MSIQKQQIGARDVGAGGSPKGMRARGSAQRPPVVPGRYRELPPAAQRLLEGARRVLEDSGYDSLSVKTICREAGVNKNMVVYHFGGKNGLLVALVEWLLYEIGWDLRVMSTARDGTRESVLRTSAEEYLSDLRAARLFFDLFPHLVEDPSMAIPLRELYRTLRESHVRGIWGDDLGQAPNVVRRLAAMSIALFDGLAVQAITEPGSVEVAPTLALWWSLVDGALASARQADQPVS